VVCRSSSPQQAHRLACPHPLCACSLCTCSHDMASLYCTARPWNGKDLMPE
jgi:hypothetical protein